MREDRERDGRKRRKLKKERRRKKNDKQTIEVDLEATVKKES